MSDFIVSKTELFGKLVKRLSKRYKNIETDIDTFLDNITTKDDFGVHLGNNLYKVRIRNSNNNKGESAGYRLISYLKIKDNELVLVYLYSKSDIGNIDEDTLDKLALSQLP